MKKLISSALDELRKSADDRHILKTLDDEKIATLIENNILPGLLIAGDTYNVLMEAVTRLRRANGGRR